MMNKKILQQFIEEGEGYRIEFKEKLSALDKEMCAFANASGGWIFLGIKDNGDIKRIDITNKLKSQVQDIANNCDPKIKILLHKIDKVLAIEVREGIDKPYRCKTGFYNRIGPNSKKLSRNEIVEFIQHEGRIRFDELVNKKFLEESLDNEKLDAFLKKASISKVIEENLILKNLGLLEIQEDKAIYNNCAVLFFAHNLSDFYNHTSVVCALYNGTDKVAILDRKEFNQDIISNVDETMLFLKQHLKVYR